MTRFNGYCADVLFDQAMTWMDQSDPSKPFFTYIATSIPHVPIAAPQKFLDMYKDACLTKNQQGYYAMVSAADANLGRLLGWLEGKTFSRETIVIFMTDNGHAISGAPGAGHDHDGTLKEGGLYNAGLRGGKAQSWHGSTCVPFFIRWPGVTKVGENDTLSSAMDILPTFAAIADVELDDPEITGYSLLPNIMGKESVVPDNRILVSHMGRWDRSDELEKSKFSSVSVYNKQFRLSWGFTRDKRKPGMPREPQLFDYLSDRAESTDVAGRHPELVEQFKRHLDRWWEEMKPGMVNDLHQIKTGKIIGRAKKTSPTP